MIFSKLALGTVQFGLDYGISNSEGRTDTAEVKRILELAAAQGIDLLDTARLYGKSEDVLGEIGNSGFRVVTKFALSEEYPNIETSIHQSLDKLNQNSVYGLLAHRPSDLLASSTHWASLQQLKSDRKVKKIGYSLYYPEELEQLLELGYMPDIIQIPMNVLDRRFAEYLPELTTCGVEVHVRSSLLQGLFFVKAERLSGNFNEVKPFIQSLQQEFESDSLLAAALIREVANIDGVSKVILGVNRASHLQGNLDAFASLEQLGKSIDSCIPDLVPERIIIPSLW